MIKEMTVFESETDLKLFGHTDTTEQEQRK